MPDPSVGVGVFRRNSPGYSSPILLRPATSAELARAFQLIRENMQPYLDQAGVAWDQRWMEQNYSAKDNYSVFMRDQWRGFLSIELSSDKLFIHTLQLVPESQGRIFGIAVFEWLLEQAAGRGVTTLACRAFRSSPALSLYEKLGFRIIAEDGMLVNLSLNLTNIRP